MKKILLFLILFISSITLVNATSDDIVYDWGNYIHSEIDYSYSYIIDAEEYNGNTLVLGNIYENYNHYLTIAEYDNTGKKTYENSVDITCNDYSFLENEKIFCFTSSRSITVLDKKLEEITELEIEYDIFNTYSENTDKYYIIGPNLIDKKTYEVKHILDFVEEHEKYNAFDSASPEEKNKIIKEIIDDIIPNSDYSTYFLFNLNIPPIDDENISHISTTYDSKKYALTYYNSTTKACELEIYNDELKVELSKEIECDVDPPQILLYENSFVIIKEMVSDYVKENEYYFEEVTMNMEYNEYDYKGNEIYSTELKKIIIDEKEKIDQYDLHGLGIKKITKNKEGFNVLIEFYPYPDGNITEEDPIAGRTAVILKYSYIYDIVTKSDGNGTITATKVQAGSGEEIKYEITPKEGYVLGVVKITDSNGNTITTTNSTFTMPSSDVTIEVTFVAENPDTASKTLFIFSSFLIIITSIVLMIKQIKEFKWIKN